jgi:3-phosphoglycerate kinase
MKSLKNAALKNKRAIIRLDLDVPRDSKGNVTDNSRLREALPTLKLLSKAKQIILMGHSGRPESPDKTLSTDKITLCLEKLLKTKIKHLKESITKIPKDKWIMLENLRFHPEEQENDLKFAKKLASYADIYVNESFATAHRDAASITGITRFISSYPGLHLEQEVKKITAITKNMKKPFILVLGGAKLDKMKILQNLVKKADAVLIGGAMMFTFMKALGMETGKSKISEEEIPLAKKILNEAGRKIMLPIDTVLDNKKTAGIERIPPENSGYDIGEETAQIYAEILKKAGTIIWNGPMGLFEKGFAQGNNAVAKAIISSKAKSLIGGGDTTASAKKYLRKFTYYTTAGGAFLELIAGKKLAGINALNHRNT